MGDHGLEPILVERVEDVEEVAPVRELVPGQLVGEVSHELGVGGELGIQVPDGELVEVGHRDELDLLLRQEGLPLVQDALQDVLVHVRGRRQVQLQTLPELHRHERGRGWHLRIAQSRTWSRTGG